MVGSRRARRHFIERFAIIPSYARILDIGCGPGTLIPFLGDRLGNYVGFDHNPRYIKMARDRFNREGYSFFCADCSTARNRLSANGYRFDVVLAAAVLHHLDNNEALELLQLAAAFCEPHGFFASYDPAIIERRNPIASGLIRADRGAHVRTPQGYEALLRSCFSNIKSEVRCDLMSVPYTLVFFRASTAHTPHGLVNSL